MKVIVEADGGSRGNPGPAGAGLVVRAFRTDMPLAGQFRGGRPAAVTDWLRSRAATLDWLEEHAYPAPRMIRTRSGDLVGRHERAGAVQQQHVDIVGAQTLEAGFAGALDMQRRQAALVRPFAHASVNFGRNHDFFTASTTL